MPSSEFSPDCLLGGRGYIQSVKDMRGGLANTVELLSSFTDTIHDEVNADHWSPVENKADIGGIVSDAKKVQENPEEFVEGEFGQEGESEPLVNPEAENPEVEGEDEEEDEEEDETGSQLPPDVPRTSSVADYDKYAVAFDRMMKPRTASKTAGGALDVFPFSGGGSTILDWDVKGPQFRNVGPTENYDVEDQILDSNSSQNPMEEQELMLDALQLPGQAYPTDGDDYRLSAVAARVASGYSWLPGADNKKSMNWYGLGMTESDMRWMRDHCEPDMPPGILPERQKIDAAFLWDGIRVN
jgi:hypothetical protein